MSDDFQKLIEEIEAEARAEGPAAEAELRDLRREFSAEAKRMASANGFRRSFSTPPRRR